MSDDKEHKKKCPPPGAPTWIVTFSDLMSLLLAFFVLLFSFSELDKQKYKRLAGSMKAAFGVQREVYIKEQPKGVTIIAQEFSPGVVMPTPINQVRQTTTDVTRTSARVMSTKPKKRQMLEKDLKQLRKTLAPAVKEGRVQIEDGGDIIIIRLKDKGLFESGSAEIGTAFREILSEVAVTLAESPGEFAVSGHTDNMPITTNRFRSNWDLSSARAVSVLEALLDSDALAPDRFQARGFGDTRPIDDNASAIGRAENRRVEIAIQYGSRPEDGPDDDEEQKRGDSFYRLDDAAFLQWEYR